MKLELREYQRENIDALQDGWKRGLVRLATVLPTGSGKTVTFAELCRMAWSQGMRPLVLVHRDELANQTQDKLHGAMPDSYIGKVKAEWNQTDADVIVGSVQTLARERRLAQLSNIGMIVVDECHHAMAPSYLQILHTLGSFADAQGTPTAGFTATLVRGDRKGLGDVWEEVVYEKDILWMIQHGYLVEPKGKQVRVDGLDLAQVARSRGDMQEGDLGRKLMSVGAGEHAAVAYAEHAQDRQGVVFWPTVESTKSFARDFIDAGISSEVITGETPLEDRAETYKRVLASETQVLHNCMVLTEGFDLPQLSCAVVGRPTENAGLYTQMVGRVLRPWTGKRDALVLDLVGVAGRHKLATLKDLTKHTVEPKEGEGLLEAKERHEREAGRRGEAEGERAAVEVDLFGRSRSAWLQTYAGVHFIPTRQSLFFLWPTKTGHFWVGRCSNRTTADGTWLVKDVPLEYGMAWAEQAATKEDPSVASREASWRVRRQHPSDAQIGVAERQGLPWHGKSKAEVSDMLSVHFASRLLDPRGR